jgi:hypothetical protein
MKCKAKMRIGSNKLIDLDDEYGCGSEHREFLCRLDTINYLSKKTQISIPVVSLYLYLLKLGWTITSFKNKDNVYEVTVDSGIDDTIGSIQTTYTFCIE